MFLVLSRGVRPELGRRMRCFVAMGPAVYAGPVLRTFPFNLMRLFTIRDFWQFIFGCECPIRLPGVSGSLQRSPRVHPFPQSGTRIHARLALRLHRLLRLLFHLRLRRRQMGPSTDPQILQDNSAIHLGRAALLLSCQPTCVRARIKADTRCCFQAGWSHQGCLFDEDTDEHWFGRDFPPLQLVWGTLDTLCPGAPTVERIRNHEIVIRDRFRELRLEDYHHLDLVRWDCRLQKSN